MEFSEHSTPVVGFDSTWKNDKEVLVRDTSTDVMDNSVKKTETGTATADFKEIAVEEFILSSQLSQLHLECF